jgi:hypothetical protein
LSKYFRQKVVRLSSCTPWFFFGFFNCIIQDLICGCSATSGCKTQIQLKAVTPIMQSEIACGLGSSGIFTLLSNILFQSTLKSSLPLVICQKSICSSLVYFVSCY